MSAIFFILSAVLAAQVGGGGGRYGESLPANDPPAALGDLLNDATKPAPITESSVTPSRSDSTYRAATNNSISAPVSPPERQLTPNQPPATSTYQPQTPIVGTQPLRPSSAAPPVTSSPPARRNSISAMELIEAILTRPTNSRLAGKPVQLKDVVHGASSRVDQTARIEAYWDLCSAVADFYLGLIEQQELASLQQQLPAISSSLRQAEAELNSRVATAERAARVAQMRLAGLMGSSLAAELPLPEDLPHCGDYLTRYEEKFASGAVLEARELHELLPLRLAELEAEAAAVVRSQQWVDAVASRHTASSDGTGVLHALELLALHRRAFVQLVRDYNRKITRYTELATPGRLGTDRLVAMLIRTDGSPAVAQRQPESQGTTPRTFSPATNAPADNGMVLPIEQ